MHASRADHMKKGRISRRANPRALFYCRERSEFVIHAGGHNIVRHRNVASDSIWRSIVKLLALIRRAAVANSWQSCHRVIGVAAVEPHSEKCTAPRDAVMARLAFGIAKTGATHDGELHLQLGCSTAHFRGCFPLSNKCENRDTFGTPLSAFPTQQLN
jgi:hypothetical protein